jgi:hypothetical protein
MESRVMRRAAVGVLAFTFVLLCLACCLPSSQSDPSIDTSTFVPAEGSSRGLPSRYAYPAPPTDWSTVKDSCEFDGLRVRVANVLVSSAATRVDLELTNTSADKVVHYGGWSYAGRSPYASLMDDKGNFYQSWIVNYSGPLEGKQANNTTIQPKQTITDVLVFDPLVASAKEVRIELPGENIQQKNSYRWLRVSRSK